MDHNFLLTLSFGWVGVGVVHITMITHSEYTFQNNNNKKTIKQALINNSFNEKLLQVFHLFINCLSFEYRYIYYFKLIFT